MANLSIRRLEDEIYEELKARAEQHGVSMEEEVRQILRRALAAPDRLGQFALQCFGPVHGADLDLPPRPPHEPLDLDR